MPISRLPNGKLLYFAHVPKCAGSAVERYLSVRFGALGLHDAGFNRHDPDARWSRTSPQHMPEAVRRDLLPDTLFDAIFATVRHPVTRLRSIFLFQREVERKLPAKLTFGAWLDTLPRQLTLAPYALDGHLRPMAEIVPAQAQVFPIEDGLTPLVEWLDTSAGTRDGAREIAPFNVLAKRVTGPVEDIPLTPRVLDIVATLYAEDFKRFGYPVDPDTMQDKTKRDTK